MQSIARLNQLEILEAFEFLFYIDSFPFPMWLEKPVDAHVLGQTLGMTCWG